MHLENMAPPPDAIAAAIMSAVINSVRMHWMGRRRVVVDRGSVRVVRMWGVIRIRIDRGRCRCRCRGRGGVRRSVRWLVRRGGMISLLGSGRDSGESRYVNW